MGTETKTAMLFVLLMNPLMRSCQAVPPDFQGKVIRGSMEETMHGRSSLAQQANTLPMPCQYLSKEECIRRNKDNFSPPDATTSTSSNITTRSLLTTAGTSKVLVLCVRFSDHVDRGLPSAHKIDFLWNAGPGETDADLLPTGSVREFVRQNSYGKVLLEAIVKTWRDTDNTEAFYSFGLSGRHLEMQQAMFPYLDYLDAQGEDFSQYDQDGDGILDVVAMMHSGYPAENEKSDCYNRIFQNRIWSHSVQSYLNADPSFAWVSSDGKYRLGAYVVASALRSSSPSQCTPRLARIGVLTHEFLHTWGLPDLYETNPYGQLGFGSGFYDIMSHPHGVDGTQIYPCNLSPWSKIRLGWLEPIEITHDGEYLVDASALSPTVFAIRSKFPSDEYLLIENRQPIGYDSLLWDGGLLIWKIDDNVENNNNPGFPGMSGWPGNGLHYRVAVLQADRQYDLERKVNEGDKGDFWTAGHELLPGPTDYQASSFSEYPNTNAYAGTRTGIRIYDISQSSTVMSFKVEGLGPAPPTPSPTTHSTRGPTPFPTLWPSLAPTWPPTISPSARPTPWPTNSPPTWLPSLVPSALPSFLPSQPITLKPTRSPTEKPTRGTREPSSNFASSNSASSLSGMPSINDDVTNELIGESSSSESMSMSDAFKLSALVPIMCFIAVHLML